MVHPQDHYISCVQKYHSYTVNGQLPNTKPYIVGHICNLDNKNQKQNILLFF
jgi:hypothetical protein